MKKLMAIALVIVMVFTVLAILAMAAPGGKDNPANDNPQNLYLYEKDANWDIVWGGAWGKMSFRLSSGDSKTFDCVFNGHELVAGTKYSLIYYPEPQTTWPWPVTVIADETSNSGGDIHLAGSYDFAADLTDVKIWLVLTADISGGSLSGWNPTDYLFEYDLISYDDTDVP